MPHGAFVGRSDAVEALTQVLNGSCAGPGKLGVLSIEGPGGIGKTSLLDHVLQTRDFSDRQYLQLRADGGITTSESGYLAGLNHLVDSAYGPALQDKPAGHYFPSSKKTLRVAERVKRNVMTELEPTSPADPEVRTIFDTLLDAALAAGKRMNDLMPLTKDYLDARQLEKWRQEELEQRLKNSRAARPSLPTLGGILPEVLDFTHLALSNAIKDNAAKALADALMSDLSALLSGYLSEDTFKPRHARLPGVHRLLLIVDDYEALCRSWGAFLVGQLLPRLKHARFPSVVILLGRDRLEATHPDWDSHLKGVIVDRIALQPLNRAEMEDLLRRQGVKDPQESERAWADTEGYPYFVQLWLEEHRSGGRTAVTLQRFYDRITHWMTVQQKCWLEVVLVLEVVNKLTLAGLVYDPQEVHDLFEWFKRDGSVRDTNAEVFRVREYMRSRLTRYLEITDPGRLQELRKRRDAAAG
jgi:hypothetical protein